MAPRKKAAASTSEPVETPVENTVISVKTRSKKKSAVAEVLPPVEPIPENQETAEMPVPPVEICEVKPKAKRERKSTKHPVVAIVSQEGIQGIFSPEIKRPLIAHLPIHSSEVKFYDQGLQYDPNPPPNPVAYEEAMTNPFIEDNLYNGFGQGQLDMDPATPVLPVLPGIQEAKNKKKVEAAPNPTVQTPSSPQNYGPSSLLVAYANSKESRALPDTTDIACFWCCEKFESRPCVVPSYIAGNVWHVYGNFCTPHCASAYLLSEILDTHVRWERLALLHRLYASYCGGRIYPAPGRETLERFGGPMTTVAFRKMCEERKIRADVHMPPMVSILASMDTKPIDFYETSLRNTVTSLPVIQQSESLKLRRTKPLKDRESTLDACLNIQIRTR